MKVVRSTHENGFASLMYALATFVAIGDHFRTYGATFANYVCLFLDAEQLNLEDEGRVWRDRACLLCAITQLLWDIETELTAYRHELQTFGPTFDHLVQTK